MTDYEVERALGCTPCVCGDLTTWHSKCYRGKTTAELDAGHKAAMRKARAHLKRQANSSACEITRAAASLGAAGAAGREARK